MSTNKPPKSEPEVHVHDVSKLRGHLKIVGGSMSDDWNNLVANQTTRTLWFFADSDPEEVRRERHAAVDALMGIKPGDELEGMIAAQLIACHNASMECYRRAMIHEQSFEGRREALNQASKLSRTYATLLESLNRHRGKGQQKVTVEHVHVHPGGQAVVGVVEPSGGGDRAKLEDRCHATQIAHAPQSEMWGSLPDHRPAVPERRDAEWPVP